MNNDLAMCVLSAVLGVVIWFAGPEAASEGIPTARAKKIMGISNKIILNRHFMLRV